MEPIKQRQKTIQLRIDKKISALKEFIFQLKENQTISTIDLDRESLINACNSLEKYEEISNKLHHSFVINEPDSLKTISIKEIK